MSASGVLHEELLLILPPHARFPEVFKWCKMSEQNCLLLLLTHCSADIRVQVFSHFLGPLSALEKMYFMH